MKPMIIANHLLIPTIYFNIIIENIVIKKGLTKNNVIALANESFDSEK